MNETHRLFSEFPPVTAEQWKEIIIKELKGADYEKKLLWNSPEGIVIKPFYTKEDVPSNFYQSDYSENVHIRRSCKTNNNWVIFEEIYVSDIEKANYQATDALKRGAEGIEFIIQDKIHYELTSLLKSKNDLARLLQNINLEKVPIRFICGCNTGLILSLFDEYLQQNYVDKEKVQIIFDYDPIGHLILNGNFFTAEEHVFAQSASLVKYAKQLLSDKSTALAVNGYFFQNAGATVLQELAFSLAIAAEYLTNLSEHGIAVEDVAQYMTFNFGVASNYFLEIAKFRAARYLWSKLLEAYEVKSQNIFLNAHAVTTTWNKTAYDPYVNLLRLTTEAMSAVLGGVNSLTVRPFDVVYKSPDSFSQRLSRNIQLLLKEEVHLDRVIDPAGGSYYIESLTFSLINEAWKMFLQINEKGGFVQLFKEGIIQSMVEQTQQKRDMAIAMRQEILLGTNQYPNINEVIKEQVLPCILKGIMPSGKPTYKPIKIYRGAEAFENLRLETEQMKKRPSVFLLTFGNLAMRKARANFSTNFFGCAGYEIMDNPGFSTIEEGINEARKSTAEIVVICSSDEEYPEIVPPIVQALNNEKILVLAGYPKEHLENFKSLGLKHFIHIKSNVLETLKGFNALIKEGSYC
ncbi:MAG: methylmalonyl-CoA mutase subunit beta [Bacteroidales bacterium]|nr:methylmalonyl-CoA mutase subunit beta [Bacteroidales bacterium]